MRCGMERKVDAERCETWSIYMRKAVTAGIYHSVMVERMAALTLP